MTERQAIAALINDLMNYVKHIGDCNSRRGHGCDCGAVTAYQAGAKKIAQLRREEPYRG